MYNLYIITDCGNRYPAEGIIYGVFDSLEKAQNALEQLHLNDQNFPFDIEWLGIHSYQLNQLYEDRVAGTLNYDNHKE